jgi:uncharacterized membrane protein YozB (DUF420 family)
MTVADLPAVNATLNAVAATLLVVGYLQIRRGRRRLHRGLMLGAVATSALFLLSYVVYHAQAGSRPFTGTGTARLVYFSILVPHVLLAAAVVPLAAITLVRGLRRRDVAHRRIARVTFPIWMFVSVTGVLVYLMLYHLDA